MRVIYEPSYLSPELEMSGNRVGDLKLSNGLLMTWNGLNWVAVYSGFSADLADLLEWVRDKKAEEEELDALLKEYPTLQDAKNNFDILLALVKNNK